MTLIFEFDLDWVQIKHRAKYVGQRLFRSTVIVLTVTHAHTRTH